MEQPKDIVKLQCEELSIGDVTNLVASPKCGAISSFIGTTRDSFENKKVVKLEYEAYEPMAIKEMKNICAKIRSQWNVHHIAIYHRLGEVPVTKASVIIAISSPHRQESLNAMEYAINALKSSVPIWKKEIYDTDDAEWKENKECAWSNITDAGTMSKGTIGYNVDNIEFYIKKEEEEQQQQVQELDEIDDNDDKQEAEIIIDPNLVQICATPAELNRRIESFIERKREQVNVVNVQEFCCHREQSDEDSCARVDAILIQHKDSKSHVKVHRVLNTWGPQTVDQSFLRKVSGNQVNSYTSVLDDRISTTERILGINRPVPKDVYQRLKNIEDRILYLEGVSPEYKNFWVTEEIDSLKGTFKPVRKRTYSTAELDNKLHELEDKYAKKVK